jgi:hypothetical protein
VGAGELVQTWTPRVDNPFHGRLLRDGNRFAFWASDGGWFLIDPAVPSISISAGAPSLRRELRLFGVPTAVCAFEQGDVSVHASAVEVLGKGVLLAGPSQYGKTTLAAAFARAGHRLLSEDSTRCRGDTVPSIWPGPAVLRLREDIASQVTVPGTRPTESEEGRVPLLFDEPSRGDGRAVPLNAIVLLRRGSGPPGLELVSPAAAIRDILALTFQLPGSASHAAGFGRVADIAARVPTFNLYRRMSIDSLDQTVTLVERQLGTAE